MGKMMFYFYLSWKVPGDIYQFFSHAYWQFQGPVPCGARKLLDSPMMLTTHSLPGQRLFQRSPEVASSPPSWGPVQTGQHLQGSSYQYRQRGVRLDLGCCSFICPYQEEFWGGFVQQRLKKRKQIWNRCQQKNETSIAPKLIQVIKITCSKNLKLSVVSRDIQQINVC